MGMTGLQYISAGCGCSGGYQPAVLLVRSGSAPCEKWEEDAFSSSVQLLIAARCLCWLQTLLL